MESMDTRFLRIERSLRTHRRVTCCLILAIVSIVALGNTQGGQTTVPEVLQARRFEVVDENGKVLACLEAERTLAGKMADQDMPLLEGPKSCGKLSLRRDDGSTLFLVTENGFPWIDPIAENAPSAAIYGGSLSVRALRTTKDRKSVSLLADGELLLANKNGECQIVLSHDADGGSLQLYNSNKEIVVTLAAEGDGTGRVGAWNRQGRGRTLTPGTTASSPEKSKAPPEPATGGWNDKANWRRLKTGMGPDDVRAILGEPERLDGGGFAIWHYGRGSVTLINDRVTSWSEPPR